MKPIKRIIDLSASILGLICLSPVLVTVAFLIWLTDRGNPFYTAPRVGKKFRLFKMIKFRSMVLNADSTGVDSTGNNDPRITSMGKFIRRFKIDELPQLVNVLKGEMSLVGPRPNVEREVRLYSDQERRLLNVRPGITDMSSIVFADEGEILADKADPDIAYNQLIRPGKSRLGLFYVDNHSFSIDLKIVLLTFRNSINRQSALNGVAQLLAKYGAPASMVELAKRTTPIIPSPPPGMTSIITSRE
ncbi:MAG: sugar transferase [Acidimicrobiaceae bacterium]|nr:sugar transferase [Acidimicrobiaceae bacterium]